MDNSGDNDDLHFGYSVRMNEDDTTANLQLRLGKPILVRHFITMLRAVADEYEAAVESGQLRGDDS